MSRWVVMAGRVVAAALAGAFAIYIVVTCVRDTREVLVECYGDGPPYYGRTTNMDKWQSPALGLMVVNTVALLAVVAIGLGVRRLWRGGRGPATTGAG